MTVNALAVGIWSYMECRRPLASSGTKGAMVYRSPENGLAAGWQEGGKGVVVPGERGGRKGAPGWQDREKRAAIWA